MDKASQVLVQERVLVKFTRITQVLAINGMVPKLLVINEKELQTGHAVEPNEQLEDQEPKSELVFQLRVQPQGSQQFR